MLTEGQIIIGIVGIVSTYIGIDLLIRTVIALVKNDREKMDKIGCRVIRHYNRNKKIVDIPMKRIATASFTLSFISLIVSIMSIYLFFFYNIL